MNEAMEREAPAGAARLATGEARVAIIGLGYVGLPLALAFAQSQATSALGIDLDPARPAAVAEGRSYLRHVDAAAIARAVRERRLEATTDFARVVGCDAVLICVPTPLSPQREPDLGCVEETARAIAPHLRPRQLVVLESTTYPGTTEEVVKPLLEAGSGLVAGRDFHLAFSPEREDPGSGVPTRTIPKVVGGLTRACREEALALYRRAFEAVVPVTSTRVAELSKLLENVYRSVNIALVNELKLLCERMGLDVWEVIDAAGTKPFGFMRFQPGPGLGGHCIPVDPFYLTWKARQYGFETRLVELAGEINTAMPAHVVQRTMDALDERGVTLKGAHVLVLGVAYKKDVDDARESPAVRILELLQEKGALAVYHDPYVPRVPRLRQRRPDLVSVPLSDAALEDCDAVVIATDHGCIDYARVVAHAPLVIDTRNACRALTVGREKIVKS